MSATTRQAITISVLMIAGIAFFANDMHRTILAAVWPYLLAFAEYQAK